MRCPRTSSLRQLEQYRRARCLGWSPASADLSRAADALAAVYERPLDEVAGIPPIEDPRVHISPRRFHDQTILPPRRGTIGVRAFKHVVDGSRTPRLGSLRTHSGFERVHVIRGRLTLILGDRTMILSAGEAAEFDTRSPHWFGGADDGGVEYLSLFGPEGQRVHMKS